VPTGKLTFQMNDEEMLKSPSKIAAGATRIPAAIQGSTTGPNAESHTSGMGPVNQIARAEAAPGPSPNSGQLTVSIIVVQQFFGLTDELIPVIIRVESQLISAVVFVELILHL
jgi:L-serine deaminase